MRRFQLSRRDLIAAGAGLALPVPAIAKLLPSTAGRIGYVVPQAFGAVPSDARAARSNVRAFNAMADHALARGLEMIIPAATWYVAAEGSPGSGWVLPTETGRTLHNPG